VLRADRRGDDSWRVTETVMKRQIRRIGAIGCTIAAIGLVIALYLITRPFPPIREGHDVFGFASNTGTRTPTGSVPAIDRYPARDGEQLSFQFYDSTGEVILVFVHGSSYHGAGYHTLARELSDAGVAKVYLPNLRGHYLSGQRRGDVDYIGQLEDDLADLVAYIRDRDQRGPLVLGGHSSGGGLAIRVAGGEHGGLASAYLLLSPVIPLAPTTRGGDAGGWAHLHRSRLYGLLVLNAVGVTGLNGLPIIQFNKPETFRDGTETLSYSYRLNTSFHPRYDYAADIEAMGDQFLLLIGDDDQSNDPVAYEEMFPQSGAEARVMRLPGVDHLGVFSAPSALSAMQDWFRALP
jgi:non-heme chloroperoxidase